MILDIWFAIGGIIGAVIRRFRAKDEGDSWRNYVVDSAIAALGGPLLTSLASGLGLGEDLLAAVVSNPLRAVSIGAIPAYVGLDLLTLASSRLRGTPSAEAVKEIVKESKPTPTEAKEIATVANQAATERAR